MGLKNSMVAATSSVAGSRKARTVGEDEVLRLGVHADGVDELEDVGEDGGFLRRVEELNARAAAAAPPRREAGRLGFHADEAEELEDVEVRERTGGGGHAEARPKHPLPPVRRCAGNNIPRQRLRAQELLTTVENTKMSEKTGTCARGSTPTQPKDSEMSK